jgi:arylsulfatase A-like enzyme
MLPFGQLAIPVEYYILIFTLSVGIIFFIVRFLIWKLSGFDIIASWSLVFIFFLYWSIKSINPFWPKTALIVVLMLILSFVSILLSLKYHLTFLHLFLYLLVVLSLYLSIFLLSPIWLLALILLIPMFIYFLPSKALTILYIVFLVVLVAQIFFFIYISEKIRVSYRNTPGTTEESPSSGNISQEALSNVILIVIDTARRDSLNLKEENTVTPNLKRFFEEGTPIPKFVANSPWTPPSHASLFTGLLPSEHGVFHNSAAGTDESPFTSLSSDQITLAEILHSHGIQTAGFFANPMLRKNFGFAQGFEYYVHVKNNTTPITFKIVQMLFEKLENVSPSLFKNSRIPLFNENDVALSEDVFWGAKKWIRRYSSRGPFFLFINLMEQHYIRYFFDAADGHLILGPKYYYESPEQIILQPETMKKRHGELLDWHKETIINVDYHFGSFLDFLREQGIYDDTTIVVTSDHGNLFGKYDFFDHQLSIHDQLLFVPFSIKYSEEFRDRVVHADRIYQQADIFSETLDLYGIPSPGNVRGSFFDKEIQDTIVSQLYRKPSFSDSLRGILDRDLCGTVLPIDNSYYQVIYSTNGHHEIYLLDDDFFVRSPNIYPDFQENSVIIDFFEKCPDLLIRKDAVDVAIDEETREKLKALGYID